MFFHSDSRSERRDGFHIEKTPQTSLVCIVLLLVMVCSQSEGTWFIHHIEKTPAGACVALKAQGTLLFFLAHKVLESQPPIRDVR